MKNLFNRFVREDAGQDLIEYGLLVGTHHRWRNRAPSSCIGPKVAGYFTTLDTALSRSLVGRRAGLPALIQLLDLISEGNDVDV